MNNENTAITKNRLFIGGLFFEIFLVVPRAGLEPAHPKAVDFESTALYIDYFNCLCH
ncbi:hypothetical protein [Gallibacterium anatis]|uniref:hypothetical protein n=1 Tax=Gallibacterium anatis TaxID=750 RepID=UPI00035E5008|nr:hypothetical protein [Gallibacterium anatis]